MKFVCILKNQQSKGDHKVSQNQNQSVIKCVSLTSLCALQPQNKRKCELNPMQSHSSNFMFRRKFTYNLPEKRRNELLLFASYAHLDTITQLSHHFFIFIYFDQLNHKIRLTLATAFMLSIFLAFLLFSLSLRLLTGLKKLFCFRCIIYELYMARVAHLHPVFFCCSFRFTTFFF